MTSEQNGGFLISADHLPAVVALQDRLQIEPDGQADVMHERVTPIAALIGPVGIRMVFWVAVGIAAAAFLEYGVNALMLVIGILLAGCVLFRGGRETIRICIESLAEGAKNALPVGIACAIVGIVIGTLTLTGIASTSTGGSASGVAEVTTRKTVTPPGHPTYRFDPAVDLVFDRKQPLPGHANGMAFSAYDADDRLLLKRIYYSIGGGFVVSADELGAPFAGGFDELGGVTTLAPGQSAIFVEGGATEISAFTEAWFGTSVPPGASCST